MAYLPRTLEAFARRASREFPVLLVTGARQVGKTTLLRRIREARRTYVTLDDPGALALAREDPALFLQRFQPPLLIDEIQYAPGLLPHIKMMADESGLKGLFWLTGSQAFELMHGVSESLAGRVAVVRLMGLTLAEARGEGRFAKPFPSGVTRRRNAEERIGLRELYRRIWRGSFPAMSANRAPSPELFYGSYVQTYIQRDVRDLARVGDEAAFGRFVRACAARTAQLLNLSDLARDAAISVNTAKAWLSILETSGLVYLLEPWHSNVTKRLVKTPKLFFADTGLCSHLTQWSSPETLEAGAMAGPILETWAVSEIVKSYCHAGMRPPVYFYRDKDQVEIDLVIVRDGAMHPVEIKKTASPTASDARHFSRLDGFGLKVGRGTVLCLVDTDLPLTKNAIAMPVSWI
ncbi:MAG: ATP-binding protein [Deltaproteobacteria bacterium]|nr:ATP-binding protein [Deltaproteobacteria bacterium]